MDSLMKRMTGTEITGTIDALGRYVTLQDLKRFRRNASIQEAVAQALQAAAVEPIIAQIDQLKGMTLRELLEKGEVEEGSDKSLPFLGDELALDKVDSWGLAQDLALVDPNRTVEDKEAFFEIKEFGLEPGCFWRLAMYSALTPPQDFRVIALKETFLDSSKGHSEKRCFAALSPQRGGRRFLEMLPSDEAFHKGDRFLAWRPLV